ncbi:MAG: DUF116 domain-containing protein [Candidatus Edwardsbacteria bacterium]
MKGKGLFLSLAVLSLALLFFLIFILWWLISPRLLELGRTIYITALASAGGFLLIVTVGLLLIILSSLTERDFLFPHGKKQVTVPVLSPLAIGLGQILGISKDNLRESFVQVNNSLLKAMKNRLDGSRLLILLPHCLQNFDCSYKLSATIKNCHGCQKCSISDLIKLGERYSAEISVATGGTLARRVVVETKPTAIVAVACERDLVSGIQEVYPLPVFGILNKRPQGPCRNTIVELREVEEAIQFLANNSRKDK